MKTLITSLLFISVIQFSFSQDCCPYLDNVELSPTQPNEMDSIYLILQVTTPGQGHFIGYNFTETDTLTTVEACYFSGPLAAIQTYYDTLNLGVHPAGDFNVKFIAYNSGNDTICDFLQYQSMDLTTEVESSNSTFFPNKIDISIYPNPVNQEKLSIFSENNFSEIKIYNQLGIIVLEKISLNQNQLEISLNSLASGIYFLNGSLQTGEVFSHKIIKE